ncbi:hypothetical protein ACG83_03470 [Frankia sp. R43]|uniref:DUF3987 domain-containing protein n=1 Tax=Frankia sp. R43 TaxID=269536 RepID=UPI0006CA52E8|nr:DUF3987 domain-containing protein [Frankia sp. R43]KPM56908.1 hypothetical protein ACG83_03470 [Frankia sp. R43]
MDAESIVGRVRQRQAESETPAPVVPVPIYPRAAMAVGALGDLLDRATSTGLPDAMVGGAGLGVGATCVMHARLLPNPDYPSWVERPGLWVPLIAPRSGGKSPALRIARTPLDDVEEAAYQMWRREIEDWEAAPKKARPARPARPRWTVDDVTIEMFMRVMDTTGGRCAAAVDELRTHLAGMGRYRTGGDGGDRARWLSIWDGAAVSYDRVGSDISIRVSAPVAPIVGGIQPQYVALLGDDEDGARARWLPHYSPGTVTATPTPPAAGWEAWVQKAARLSQAREWHLDTGTDRAWRAAVARWADIERRTDTSAAVAGAASKADRQALRVALVLAELVTPGGEGPIPPEAMTGAVALVDYTISVWEVLGGTAETLATSRREETLINVADRLAGWIAERGGRVTRRDIGRAKPCGIRKAAQLDEVLAEYRALFPCTVREETPEGGGTRTTVVYAPRDPRVSLSISPDPDGVDSVDTEGR